MDWNTILVGLLGGTVPVIIKAIFDTRKNRNEAADVVVDSSMKVMEALEKRVAGLEKEVVKLKKREKIYLRNQKELLSVIKELKEIMIENGIDYDVIPILEEIPEDSL